VTPLPVIDAASWVIADADSGVILAARDPQRALPPASTLKTLTALTVIPRLKFDSTYHATLQDVNAVGSRAGLVSGATYTVNDLLHAMLMPSGNDAASAVANANGGWNKTISEMNAEAQRLHLSATVAKNPSGLDAAGQLSSAQDLATIFRIAITDPAYRKLLSVQTYKLPAEPAAPGKKRGTFEIATENRLLTNGYPGIIGGKTGFTTNAGRTFVAAAKQGNRTLVISLMRIGGATAQTATQLLNWGFTNASRLGPVGQLPVPSPATYAAGPQPAAQLDQNGKPVGTSNRSTTANNSAAPAPAGAPASSVANATGSQPDDDPQTQVTGTKQISSKTDPADSDASFADVLWGFLVVLAAAIVGLRIRVIYRTRQRKARAARAAKQEAEGSIELPVDQVDLRSGDSAKSTL